MLQSQLVLPHFPFLSFCVLSVSTVFGLVVLFIPFPCLSVSLSIAFSVFSRRSCGFVLLLRFWLSFWSLKHTHAPSFREAQSGEGTTTTMSFNHDFAGFANAPLLASFWSAALLCWNSCCQCQTISPSVDGLGTARAAAHGPAHSVPFLSPWNLK